MLKGKSMGIRATCLGTNLDRVVVTLNELLSKQEPSKLNSSWIQRHAPACYRFIRKWIRNEVGAIDWDQVTRLLNSRYQRRWDPGRRRRPSAYSHVQEVNLILNRYRDKLYVFITAADDSDEQIRDAISIALVRLAQAGNTLAGQELTRLIGYTIDHWLEDHSFLSRWRGYEEELRKRLDHCIRRYRYTGSFIRYLRKTLEYAARGIRPSLALLSDDAHLVRISRSGLRLSEESDRLTLGTMILDSNPRFSTEVTQLGAN